MLIWAELVRAKIWRGCRIQMPPDFFNLDPGIPKPTLIYEYGIQNNLWRLLIKKNFPDKILSKTNCHL